jgi:hypothetical protein
MGLGVSLYPWVRVTGLILNLTGFFVVDMKILYPYPHTRVCVCVDCRVHASQFSATPKALSERSQSNDIKEDYRRQGTYRTFG